VVSAAAVKVSIVGISDVLRRQKVYASAAPTRSSAMMRPVQREQPTKGATAAARGGSQRTLVLVVGPVGSGTGLLVGLLQRLGFHVPKPHVTRGDRDQSLESQWVVDFHARLMTRSGVHRVDARPRAWAQAAHVTVDESAHRELASWLKGQFRAADHLAVGDTGLAWFTPLWQRCARELDVAARFVILACHPVAAIARKSVARDAREADIGATVGWLNQMLFTERATREAPRVFVRHEELFEDWARAVDRVAKTLELEAITDAPWTSMLHAQQFLDPAAGPVAEATWGTLDLPAAHRSQAERTWELISQLADDNPDERGLLASLDAAREEYVRFYEEAEATASSSISAATQGLPTGSPEPAAARIARLVPARVRRRVPSEWRRAVVRRLGA
jgi:hypothetical protein